MDLQSRPHGALTSGVTASGGARATNGPNESAKGAPCVSGGIRGGGLGAQPHASTAAMMRSPRSTHGNGHEPHPEPTTADCLSDQDLLSLTTSDFAELRTFDCGRTPPLDEAERFNSRTPIPAR